MASMIISDTHDQKMWKIDIYVTAIDNSCMFLQETKKTWEQKQIHRDFINSACFSWVHKKKPQNNNTKKTKKNKQTEKQ